MPALHDYCQSTGKLRQMLCVYGAPFSGKTKLVGELSNYRHLVYLDLDNGANTLRTLPKDAQRNIDYFRLADTPTDKVGISTLVQMCNDKPGTICHDHGRWDCKVCATIKRPVYPFNLRDLKAGDVLVVDTFSSATTSAYNLLDNTSGPALLAPEKAMEAAEWDDHRGVRKLLGHVLLRLKQLPCDVVIVTHEIRNKSGMTYPLIGTGPFSAIACREFDAVVHVACASGRHTFNASSSGEPGYIAGTRTPVKFDGWSLFPLFDIDASQEQAEEQAQLANPALLLRGNALTQAAAQGVTGGGSMVNTDGSMTSINMGAGGGAKVADTVTGTNGKSSAVIDALRAGGAPLGTASAATQGSVSASVKGLAQSGIETPQVSSEGESHNAEKQANVAAQVNAAVTPQEQTSTEVKEFDEVTNKTGHTCRIKLRLGAGPRSPMLVTAAKTRAAATSGPQTAIF